MRLNIWICALSALFIAGCGSRGGGGYQPPTPGKELKTIANKDLGPETALPMKVGNQWVYEVEIALQTAKGRSTAKGEQVWKVTKVDNVANGKRITMQLTSEGSPSATYTWLVNDKGVFQTSMKGDKLITYSPPMPTVMFPSEAGRKFTWKGVVPMPNGKSGPVTMSGEILAPVRTDTASDPRMAIPIVADYNYGAKIGRQRNTIYFEPGVGIVRIVDELATPGGNRVVRTVLKSFREAK